MWVISPFIRRNLGFFHHMVARRLMGRKPRRVLDKTWLYPLLEEAMAEGMAESSAELKLFRENFECLPPLNCLLGPVPLIMSLGF